MNKQVEKNMSYSYELKCELCSHKKNICCKKSLIYGFLLLANTFRQDKIKIHTHHKEILDYLISLISKICSVDASKLKICESSGRNKAYICVIEEPDIIKSIIGSVDCTVFGGNIKNIIIPQKECCRISFLTGAFISAGFISNPKSSYHLEISAHRAEISQLLKELLLSFGINARESVRKNEFLVYMKSAEDIKDFLLLIGANRFAFDYVNTEIEKNIRNSINRVMNCENANIDKMIAASEKQINMIKELKRNNYYNMPCQLVDLAELRLENPDYSLEQLGQSLSPRLSKSGVSHRMKKITEFYSEMKKLV